MCQIADVIVVGVGGMGSAACRSLSQAGARVIGIERFNLVHALGSSHGETRVIRKAYYEHPDYVPLLRRSYELWKEIESQETSPLYRETGIVYFGASGSRLLSGVLNSANEHDLLVNRLSMQERKKFGQWFQEERFGDALFEPEAGFLKVEACVQAQIRQAQAHGAKIFDSETVLDWNATPQGVEVKTDRARYSAKTLVFTSGAWMGELLGELKLPLRILRKALCWIKAPAGFDEEHAPCYLCETEDGIFYGFPSLSSEASGLMKLAQHSGGEPASDPTHLDRVAHTGDFEPVLSFARTAFRGAGQQVARHAFCMYTMTSDENFILDFHPQHSNVVIASCCSGHGFKFSPVVGEAIRDLALRGYTSLPIEFLRLSRFQPA